MFPFRCAEIHARGCGSSTDPEVKANSGRPAATCSLLKSRSVFLVVDVDTEHNGNTRTFCTVQFVHDFLHGFYHQVRYSIGLLQQAILKHT